MEILLEFMNNETGSRNHEYTPEGSSEAVSKYSFLRTDEIYSENNTNIKYDEIVKVY